MVRDASRVPTFMRFGSIQFVVTDRSLRQTFRDAYQALRRAGQDEIGARQNLARWVMYHASERDGVEMWMGPAPVQRRFEDA